MGKIFYNKSPIPIPPNTYVDKSDGRVLAKIYDRDGNIKRRTIGVLATEGNMYPNELFQQLFPDLWKTYYHDKEYKEYELSIGLYALTLAVSHKTGLYQMLHDIYGESNVNYILDYAMYSLLDRTNTTQLYPERMRKEVLFSEKIYSDSWYSAFFNSDMEENKNAGFRIRWLDYCKQEGITEAWICVDGSNNDCEVKQSPLCAQGHPKTHSHSDIVGYMYAVSAADGKPITYYVYEGHKPDSSAFHQLSLFLSKADITVKGVLLDSGFCTDDVIQTLEDCSFDYIIMMHSNHQGYTSMLQEFGETIRWEPLYSVSDDGVFGISSFKQLFKTHSRQGWVNLYYDGVRGSIQSIDLNKTIRHEKKRLEKLIEKGRKPSVRPSLEKYLEIKETDGILKINFKYDNWRKDSHEKGFFSIVSSSDFGAETVLDIYRKRDASEKAYSIFKSQEGFDTTRVHASASILAKFAIGFIISIIRSEIQTACKSLTLDTNNMVHKLESVHIFLAPGNEYIFSRSIRADQKKLFAKFGISEEHLEALTAEVNFRLDTTYRNRYRSMPDIKKQTPKHIVSEPEYSTSNDKDDNKQPDESDEHTPSKKKRGRKKGSKDSYQRKRRTKAELLASQNT